MIFSRWCDSTSKLPADADGEAAGGRHPGLDLERVAVGVVGVGVDLVVDVAGDVQLDLLADGDVHLLPVRGHLAVGDGDVDDDPIGGGVGRRCRIRRRRRWRPGPRRWPGPDRVRRDLRRPPVPGRRRGRRQHRRVADGAGRGTSGRGHGGPSSMVLVAASLPVAGGRSGSGELVMCPTSVGLRARDWPATEGNGDAAATDAAGGVPARAGHRARAGPRRDGRHLRRPARRSGLRAVDRVDPGADRVRPAVPAARPRRPGPARRRRSGWTTRAST